VILASRRRVYKMTLKRSIINFSPETIFFIPYDWPWIRLKWLIKSTSALVCASNTVEAIAGE